MATKQSKRLERIESELAYAIYLSEHDTAEIENFTFDMDNIPSNPKDLDYEIERLGLELLEVI